MQTKDQKVTAKYGDTCEEDEAPTHSMYYKHMMNMLQSIKPEEKLLFVKQLPFSCSENELRVLANSMGKCISTDVLHDGMSMPSVNYHNSITYDAEQLLAERNKVIVEFLYGLGNLHE